MSAHRPLLVCAAITVAIAGCARPALYDSFEAPALDARWTVDSSAEASATVDAGRQVLVLQTLDNRYNHIETPLPADFGRVQVDLLNINDTSASWSPGVILYWDETNWVQVMVSLTYSLRVNWAGGEGGATGNLRPIIAGTWYRIALEMRPGEIGVLFGEPGGELAEVATVPRVPAWEGTATLIIGKGYMPAVNAKPDFDNNYGRSTRTTRVEIDDVVVGDPGSVAQRLAASAGARVAVGEHDPATLEVAFWPNVTNPSTEDTLWFADGAWQRLALVYANLDPTHNAQTPRFEIEVPAGIEVREVSFGPHELSVTRKAVDGGTRLMVEPQGFTLPADFRGVSFDDPDRPGWADWPRSRQTPALHIHCVGSSEAEGATVRARLVAEAGAGPWREMAVRVLPALPELAEGPPEDLGLSLWEGMVAHDGADRAVVLDAMMASCARLGVKRLHGGGRSDVVAACRAHGIAPFLYSWWHYSTQCPPSFRPTDDERATEASNSGSGFCPVVIAEGTGTYGEFLHTVTEKLRDSGCDGFMLDYECAMPLCFDDRCRDAFIEYTGLDDVAWPEDVRPDGRYREQWIGFRCRQGALYVRAIRDAAWAALPGCPVQAWVAGYDYNNTIESATIDVSKAAEYLTEVETPHYTLPADYSDMWFEDAGIGSVQSGIDTVQDTLEVVDIPVIFCSSIIYPMYHSTRWSDPQILDAQIQTIIAQGARGVSFWGGHFDGALDGRYQHKLVKWHNLLARAAEFLWQGERDDTLVRIAPGPSRELRAFAWRLDDRLLIAVTNLSQEPTRVRLTAPGYGTEARELLSGEAADLSEPVTIPALDGWWGVVERE